MQRFFIADIHLNENEPVIITGFLTFLTNLPANSELYILGDFFDYWIGDDLLTDMHINIAQALLALKQRNINIYFIHGNRDFLLGTRFTHVSGMQLLPAVNTLTIGGKNIVILHGDLLCTDDKSYQKFRRKMHNKWLQRLFLLLPRYFRRKIADKLRNKSQQHNQNKADYIMDVNQDAVINMMQKYHADIMIHGHTHKPDHHHFYVGDNSKERIVLGAWHDGINYIHQNDDGDILVKYY